MQLGLESRRRKKYQWGERNRLAPGFLNFGKLVNQFVKRRGKLSLLPEASELNGLLLSAAALESDAKEQFFAWRESIVRMLSALVQCCLIS